MANNPTEHIRKAAFECFVESIHGILPHINPDDIDPTMRPLLPALANMAHGLFLADIEDAAIGVPADKARSNGIAIVPTRHGEILIPELSLRKPTAEQLGFLAQRHPRSTRSFQSLTDERIAQLTAAPVMLHDRMGAATGTERFYDIARPWLRFKPRFWYGFSSRPYMLIDIEERDPVRLGSDGIHELVHGYDRAHQSDDVSPFIVWQRQYGHEHAHLSLERQQDIANNWLQDHLRKDKARSEMRPYHIGRAVLKIPGIVTQESDATTLSVEQVRRTHNSASDPFATPPVLIDSLAKYIHLAD